VPRADARVTRPHRGLRPRLGMPRGAAPDGQVHDPQAEKRDRVGFGHDLDAEREGVDGTRQVRRACVHLEGNETVSTQDPPSQAHADHPQRVPGRTILTRTVRGEQAPLLRGTEAGFLGRIRRPDRLAEVRIRAKTAGRFRLQSCAYPPPKGDCMQRPSRHRVILLLLIGLLPAAPIRASRLRGAIVVS
jgi:hypothetical protein